MSESGRDAHISATAGGFGAIVLWSTTVALARSASEQLGPLTAASVVYGVSAVAVAAAWCGSSAYRQQLRALPVRYLLICGTLFVGYMVALYVAIGRVSGREQTLEVGLLNYLWPTLTIVLALPLLGLKARLWLVPGTVLALLGVYLVLAQGAGISVQSFAQNTARNPLAYGLAATAAVLWALYSNLTRRFRESAGPGGVHLFLLATAMVMTLLAMVAPEPRHWGARPVIEAIVLGIANYAGYSLWDRAMRHGNITLVAAGSYLTPLFSTLISCVYLQVAPTASLWIGCILLVGGSVVSWLSIRESA